MADEPRFTTNNENELCRQSATSLPCDTAERNRYFRGRAELRHSLEELAEEAKRAGESCDRNAVSCAAARRPFPASFGLRHSVAAVLPSKLFALEQLPQPALHVRGLHALIRLR